MNYNGNESVHNKGGKATEIKKKKKKPEQKPKQKQTQKLKQQQKTKKKNNNSKTRKNNYLCGRWKAQSQTMEMRMEINGKWLKWNLSRNYS
ncbi:hypothetical protein AWZ03_003509 [Drosophila navojoa]|uniref:Uncharacterized protein n=1 Tax=Drosophila navojoa TaxID=7232 RepID=A0A484BMF8_DRONA|nr:hypothetical protein AWZ03_003509 [Drosophila navojoa]